MLTTNWLFDLLGINITDFVGSIFDGIIDWIFNTVLSAFADFLKVINETGVRLFELPWIKSLINLFFLFGFALFIIGVILAIVDTATEYGNGKSDFRSLFLNFFKSFLAVNAFTIVPVVLYSYTVDLQNRISKELLQTVTDNVRFDFIEFSTPLLRLIFSFAIIYTVVKVVLANIKRGGVLITLIGVGSLYMLNLPRGYTDGFNGWIKQVIALSFTSFVQTTLMFFGVATMAGDWILGLCLVLSSGEVPKIADRFGMDSSVKGNISQAAITASSAFSIFRAFGR